VNWLMDKAMRETFMNLSADLVPRLAIMGKSSHISYMTVLFRIRPKIAGL
jgi:hypothetical protein